MFEEKSPQIGTQSQQEITLPFGTEQLQVLPGFNKFYSEFTDHLLDRSDKRPTIVVFIGPTGSGKRTLISQLFYRLGNDPKLSGSGLIKRYISFAESMNREKLEGGIDPNKPHGSYEEREYRMGSDRMFELISGHIKKFTYQRFPTLIAIEASTPSAYYSEEGRNFIKGADRGYSAVRELGRNKGYREHTWVVAVRRDRKLLEAILEFRGNLQNVTPDNIADILQKAHVSLYLGSFIEELREADESRRREIIFELKETGAPPEGVLRSAREMEERIRMLTRSGVIPKTTSDLAFWRYLLFEDFGFDPTHCLTTINRYTSGIVSLHEELLVSNDEVWRGNVMLSMHIDPSQRDQTLTPFGKIRFRNRWWQLKYELGVIRDWFSRQLYKWFTP